MRLKRVVNTVFLALSISLSGYFLFFLSKNPIVKGIALVFAVAYELANKYMLSAGRTEWKKRRFFTALILFFFYGIYIIYNILSGAGFFITEIAVQDRAAAKTEMVAAVNRQKLEQLNRTIDTLNRALEVEVETSFRSRSATITEELKQRETERETLLREIETAPAETAEEKNPFRDLSNALGFPMDRFVGLVWCMVMAGICVVLIVTSEDLPEEKGKPVKSETKRKSETQQKQLMVETNNKIVETHSETDTRICAYEPCSIRFTPKRRDQLYHSNACRLKAFRENKHEASEECGIYQ